jgi:hypothetical protein
LFAGVQAHHLQADDVSALSCLCVWLPSRRFIKCLQGWKQKLQDIGYDSIVFEDPLDMLLQQMQVGGAAASYVAEHV